MGVLKKDRGEERGCCECGHGVNGMVGVQKEDGRR